MASHSDIADRTVVTIKPAKNLQDVKGRGTYLRVRNPATRQHLPKDGEPVKMSTYWRRAIRDGDVELVGQTKPTTPSRRSRTTSED